MLLWLPLDSGMGIYPGSLNVQFSLVEFIFAVIGVSLNETLLPVTVAGPSLCVPSSVLS